MVTTFDEKQVLSDEPAPSDVSHGFPSSQHASPSSSLCRSLQMTLHGTILSSDQSAPDFGLLYRKADELTQSKQDWGQWLNQKFEQLHQDQAYMKQEFQQILQALKQDFR